MTCVGKLYSALSSLNRECSDGLHYMHNNMLGVRYDELQAVPENQRRARDQILVLIHEKVQKYHKEIETFTKEQDGFRLVVGKKNP